MLVRPGNLVVIVYASPATVARYLHRRDRLGYDLVRGRANVLVVGELRERPTVEAALAALD